MCILSEMAVPPQRQSDAEFAANIHDFRELVRTRDHDGLVSALGSPELFRHACDEDRYLGIAMQGISVLAWDDPVLASEELHRFDVQRTREREGSDARTTARTLIAALEWASLVKGVPDSMGTLRDFLQRQPVLPEDTQLGATLRAEMRANPERFLTFFEGMSERCYGLPQWVLDRTGSSSESDSPVERLRPEQLHALSLAIVELREMLGRRLGRYITGLGMLGALLLVPSAAGVVLALLVLLAYLAFGEGKSYETLVRPRLAQLAIEHGVGATAAVSWILKLRRQAGRMAHYDVRLASDSALDLMAAVSARASGPLAESENDLV